MSTNVYVNLVKGENVRMTDDEFAKSYIGFEQFKSDFFAGRNVKIFNVEKEGKDNIHQFDISYDSIEFHLIYTNIKNSGENSGESALYKKRIQMKPTFKYYNDGKPHYVIASYNTYDKVIYFVAELSEYIKNKYQTKNNSSLWIDYGDITFVYKKQYAVMNKLDRIFVGVVGNKINEYEDEDFFEKIFNAKEYITKEREFLLKRQTINIDDIIAKKEISKLIRNPNNRETVLKRENYTCELCGSRVTFKDKNGSEYFEAHHLLMFNLSTQKKYKYSLDITENMVCLCPNCHKKIHYSDIETIEECVKKLLDKHSELYKIYGFDNVLSVVQDYANYLGDDEDE